MLRLFRSKRDAEKLLAEIEELRHAGAVGTEPDRARRMLQLRHRAGLELVDGSSGPRTDYPEPAFDTLPETRQIPEVAADELTPELLRAAFLRKGSLIIRGFADRADATRLAEEIEQATKSRDSGDADGDGLYEAFEPDERFAKDLAMGRAVIKSSGGGGLWGADAPLLFAHVLETFERAGLRQLAEGYLGGRPVISVDKCVMRRVRPDLFGDSNGDGQKPSAWHQDGAFMGDVRALNVWLSLSRCGDVAPGMDIVARRLDGIVATGTEGAAFDWSVSQAVAEASAGDEPLVRPIFEPGDALLFDELCLHSTAAEPDMPNVRYAIETWFFAPSGFPSDYAPLAF